MTNLEIKIGAMTFFPDISDEGMSISTEDGDLGFETTFILPADQIEELIRLYLSARSLGKEQGVRQLQYTMRSALGLGVQGLKRG